MEAIGGIPGVPHKKDEEMLRAQRIQLENYEIEVEKY
jgi:hypothetical protein